MKLGFYKSSSKAYIPHLATEQAACFDLRASLVVDQTIKCYSNNNIPEELTVPANRSINLYPHYRYLVPTNLILDIPLGYSVRVHPRSGMSVKQGVALINCEGVIDSDYVLPLFIPLINFSDEDIVIQDGDRVAQAELVRSESYELVEIKQPPQQKTSRTGGFGSTGT